MGNQTRPQDYSNHVVVPRRWLAAIMLFLLGFVLAAASAAWFAQPARSGLLQSASLMSVSAGGMYTLWILRGYATRLQDRVIRAEMRQRLLRVLPDEDHQLLDALSLSQLIALRFAANEELPDLVDYVLAQDLQDPAAIKRRIEHWQADHLRV